MSLLLRLEPSLAETLALLESVVEASLDFDPGLDTLLFELVHSLLLTHLLDLEEESAVALIHTLHLLTNHFVNQEGFTDDCLLLLVLEFEGIVVVVSHIVEELLSHGAHTLEQGTVQTLLDVLDEKALLAEPRDFMRGGQFVLLGLDSQLATLVTAPGVELSVDCPADD